MECFPRLFRRAIQYMVRFLQKPLVFEPSTNYAPGAMRYVCVGAAISRPVVPPHGGEQRRRIAPTMQYRTFTNEIRRYYVETWYIAARCAARFPVGIAGRMISAPTSSKICNHPQITHHVRHRRFVGAAISRPVVPPMGGTTSAHCADNGTIKHLQMKFRGIMSKHGAFGNTVTPPGQYGSAQKFATLAGG